MASCSQPLLSRRRVFWTTQPDACGTYYDCNAPCGIPGLEYVSDEEGRSIATNDWVRSLLLNILNTRARPVSSTNCQKVSSVGGHWSESYREDGLYIGTLIWSESAKPAARIQDAMKLLNAQLRSDAGKLIKLGIASAIEVETNYKGSNRVAATITITGPTIGTNTVNLTSERLSNEWVWR